jgi:HAE1 family hydrophobic/amphiphilic exporter-1
MNVRARCLALVVVLGAAGSAHAQEAVAAQPAPPRYSLPQLLAKAREIYPGVEAGRHALRVAEAQLLEAKMAYLPQGTIDGLVAPAPEIRCGMPEDLAAGTPAAQRDRAWREQHCLTTPSVPTPRLVGVSGVFLRAEVNLAWPVYTFGKLSAALAAAHAAVSAGEGKLGQARARLEEELRRAYHGLKLARELKATIEEGKEHLDKALRQTQEELREGKGAATVTDLRRLQVIVAEVDARRLEVVRGETLALAGLRVLVPVGLPRNFDIDEEPLDRPPEEVRPLDDYQDVARKHRPEVRLLDAAVAARQAALDLQAATFYPDLLLVARFSYAYTSSADVPQNVFYSNPLNGLGFGGGLALRLSWDYGLKVARLRRARAELAETGALRRQAVGGVLLEVEKARLELTEAQARVDTTRRGERAAQAWLTAVAQNFGIGLAETRDFSDALLAFFQMRLRWLQALYDAQIAHAALLKASGAE